MKTIKKLFPIFFISFLLLSCNTVSEKNISENEKLITNYFELFNKHQWENLSNLYIDNAEFKDPSLGTGIVKQTKKDFVKKYSELNQLFPDLKDKIIQIYPSGENNIIVEFISTGSGPGNSKFELPICTIFTIENGKITKDFTYYDNIE
ncbi:nuclear transport factor 2 family protein [Chryseobacterium polytrichastri]|uniref:Predicted SnoaL-like aldol condensation-catalyzing enzyme n=1 Tax=Chryseobacterium polytrichastri TaxID=1302687 RepID=A0A1M6UBH7_9FLAO|nr:nuclear transport factor 2 family protein [Chryseobacterium polytrichastri]SHK66595.1 Predicted SnoaL-like aldol condensation-catalyzing enzyme [Chryseobacterium polytrichastri]